VLRKFNGLFNCDFDLDVALVSHKGTKFWRVVGTIFIGSRNGVRSFQWSTYAVLDKPLNSLR